MKWSWADASEVTEVDKKEYQEKLSEINRLIAVEDYNSAAQVADSIDWKRVRNVQTLLMISEVYEAVNRYDMSKNLLLRAYAGVRSAGQFCTGWWSVHRSGTV